MGGGSIQKFHIHYYCSEWIDLIFVFSLGTNIFNIRIQSVCSKQIYQTLVFSKLYRYEFIQYSYLVKFSFTNIFVFGQEINIGVTLGLPDY